VIVTKANKINQSDPTRPPYRRAVTFGQKYRSRDEQHPRLGHLAHPDGYIAVEAQDQAQFSEFIIAICGRAPGYSYEGGGGPQYAFDYDLDEFEADPRTEILHPRGRLADFSALAFMAPTRVPQHQLDQDAQGVVEELLLDSQDYDSTLASQAKAVVRGLGRYGLAIVEAELEDADR